MQIFNLGKKTNPLFEQIIPIALTVAVFAVLAAALFFSIKLP